MNTSLTALLSDPVGDDLVPISTFSYLRTRNKRRLYSLVMGEFKRSGISQATLARRLGKKPEIVCRLLAVPGNWKNDTVSDLLFAISGAEVSYSLNFPLSQPPRNDTIPEWLADDWVQLDDDKDETTTTTNIETITTTITQEIVEA